MRRATKNGGAMMRQKSFSSQRGVLYLVATPIGNLDDMTFRAVETLKDVDLILAEDTRTSAVLCERYGIETPRQSYHRHNERERVAHIRTMLDEGKRVALISDAGTPLISDPGAILVEALLEAGHPVIAVPGANAAVTALSASGLDCTRFLFYGFLPPKEGQREQALRALADLPYTLVFYEAKHRIDKTLSAMLSVFGDRAVTLGRELTKRHETYVRTTLSACSEIEDMKGEIVIVVEGARSTDVLGKDDILAHIELLLDDGWTEMDAIKRAAKERNMKKNDVYMAFQRHKKAQRDFKE